ncbi:MAG: lactose/L-arabinose transport system substrate-binding [Ignavibacteria bacterium]|nr:MAG: lactose/L-arabinose transport system substrate-binding [Ignavibacteria bacterium]
MNKTRTKYLAIALLVLSISCSQQKSDKVEINFWAMGVEGETVAKLIPEFEKQNPNIKVKVLQIAWIAAHEKLITAFASETLPDVFQLGNTWIPEFEAISSIEPLNKFVSKSSVVSREKFFDGIWDTNVLDSIVYGIPWYVDTRVMFYRTDILKAVGYNNAPKTWAELYDASKKIKQKFNSYSFFIPTNEWLPFILFGLQNNAELLKNKNQYANFSSKEFKEAIVYLTKFYHEDLAPVDMQQVLNVYQAFGEGFFSMYITGPWNVAEFQNRLPKDVQDKWMTAPLPSPNNEYPGYSLPGGSSIVLNAKSKNKEAAWKWIEFLASYKTQYEFYKLVSSLPAVKKSWEYPEFVNDRYIKAFYEQLQRTKPAPEIPEWEQIVFQKVQQEMVEPIARKRISIDDALKKLDEDVNKILEKRRYILSKKP